MPKKNNQLSALKSLSSSGPSGSNYEPEVGGPAWGDEDEDSLGSYGGSELDPSRDESQTKHVGRIGDLNASPEPKLATKPYGSEDGQAPDQAHSRGERSPGSINEKRIARSSHPGGGGGVSGSSNPGSDQGHKGLEQKRSERGQGLGRLGKQIPGKYKTGAGQKG